MRLNTGTIALILVALVIIGGVILLGGQPADAPGDPTPTSAVVSGSVFVGADAANASSVTLTNYESGEYVTFSRDAGGAWTIAGTYASDITPPIQETISTELATVQTLLYTDRFDMDQLSGFGLDTPRYTLVVNAANGTQYMLYLGDTNPSGNRYYAVAQTFASAMSTAEITPESTAEVTPESTAEMTAEATAEITAEATAEVTPESTAEVTPESTAEMTAEATAEAALDPLGDGAVMDALTLDRFIGAAPTLSGMQAILLIETSLVDRLLGLITAPPYAPPPPPTLFPTPTPNPFSEVDQTATQSALFAATATAAAQVTPEVTVEITIEATAEATAEATP